MIILEQIPYMIKRSETRAVEIAKGDYIDFDVEVVQGTYQSDSENSINRLYSCDNINAIKDLLDNGYKSRIDLIYIDPPFFTMNNYWHKICIPVGSSEETIEYLAYNDIWKDGLLEYLEMLTTRLFLMRELLSDIGTIYLHLDFRTVHYAKIIMDCIFGSDRFLNELVWAYKSGGASKKYYSRKHDTILVYTKTDRYIFNPQKEKSYNRGLKPYRFKGVKEFKDEIGWHTWVNLKDVWQIDMVGRTSKERVGYGTQKPEKLLERIVLTSSNKGSIVADFFSGSGTTPVVAEKNGRNWFASDLGEISIATIRKRLLHINKNSYKVFDKIKIKSLVDLQVRIEHCGDQVHIFIELKKYLLTLDEIELKNQYKQIIDKVLNDNSLALLDYIALGYKNEKNEYLIKYETCRDNINMALDPYISVRINESIQNNLLLKCIDIFGNSFFQLIKIPKANHIELSY